MKSIISHPNRFSFSFSLIVSLLCLMFFTNSSYASQIKAIASGDWGSNATWDLGRIPQAGDTVLIGSDMGSTDSIIVTISSNVSSIDSLAIDVDGMESELLIINNSLLNIVGGISIDGALTVGSGGGQISLGGDWIRNTTFTQGSSTVTFSGNRDQRIGGTGSTTFNHLTVNKTGGTVTVSRSFTIQNGNLQIINGTLNLADKAANRGGTIGDFTLSNNSTLRLNADNFPSSYTNYTLSATSTVDYNGADQSIATQSYGNLSLSGSGNPSTTDSLLVRANFTIGSGVTFTGTSSRNYRIRGNYSNSGTFSTSPNTTVIFDGSGSQTITGGNFRNLTLNNSGGICSLKSNIGIVSGNVVISSGTLELQGFTLNRSASGGTFTISGGATLKIGGTNTFPSNFSTVSLNQGSTVNYSGTSQTVSAQTYGNLSLSESGTKTAGGSIVIKGNFSNSVTYDATSTTTSFSGNSTLSGGGTFNFGNVTITATDTINDGGLTVKATGNWTNSGLYVASGTVEFNGSSAQSIGASNFNNITFSNGGTKNISDTLTVTGNWSNASSAVATSSAVTFRGSSGQLISSNSDFSAIVVNKTSNTVSASTNITATGSITISSGTFSGGTNTISVGGNWNSNGGSVSTSGTISITGNLIIGGIVTFSGSGNITCTDFTINNSTSISLGSTSLSLSGNLTKDGTLTPETSTITMTGSGKSITGTNVALNNFVVSGSVSTASNLSFSGNITNNGTFSASGTTDIAGVSTFTGVATFNNVNINSTKSLALGANTTLEIQGTFANSGTFTTTNNTSNTVKYSSASITILGTTYHNLTITGGNTKTAGGNITLNGNLAVESSSTFDGLSSSVTFNGTNTLSTADAGTFQFNDVIINSTKSLDAGSISILVKGNWTNNGTFSGSGSSTVTFNGSSQQTSKSVFNNLTISSSGTVTATGNLRINGNFNINSGTFAAGTTSDTLKGNFTRSGGTIDPSTSTFVLNGSSGQTLSGATFNNVLVNNSNNISLGSNLTVNGTLTISSGDILTGDENGVILGANGSLSESAGNTVVGKTTTMRNLNTIGTTYTLGNIGIEISTASVLPGTTTITRYTGTSLNGGGSFSSNSSIERYFNVAPTTNSGLNVSITFRYDELELTDHSENTLSLWRSSNSGTTWTGLGGTANAGDNSVTVAGVNSLGYITAADVNHPLQPNSLTARVYRDADGKSSTSNDWYGKKWFIQLRRTDTNGEIVGQVNGDSILIIDTLSAGTYVALVSDSAGWYHLSNRVNSGTIDSSSVSSKSISISGGTSNLVEFMNFHPGKITVRKYLDNDGNFSTSDDRSGKKWHLVIYKGSVSAQNIQRQVTSDSILVDSLLGDGNYIIEEKDSIGWVHLGYISSDSTVENTTNQVLMTITDGQTKFVNFVNRVNLNSIVIEKYLDVDVNFATSGDRQEKRWHLTVRRGSLSGDIVAQVDSSRLVVSGLEPNQTYYAIEADTLGWRPLGLIFKQNGNVVDSSENSSKSVQITFTGGGNTATVQFINSNADSAYFITFSQTTDPAGWGKGGSKVAKILKKAPTKPPTAKKPIIKPTIGNILDTVFSKIYGKLSVRANIVPSLVGLNEKKIPNGLYLGVPSEALNSNLKARADTAVFMFTKDAKAFRSFVNHDGSARGFDGNNKSAEWNLVRSNSKKPSKFKGVVKAKNPKDGTNNKLAGELAALRMNMALYASGVLPSGYTGFKSLIFDMGNDSLNVLNGKTIEQLALIVDTALTFWTRYYSNRYPTSNAFYETLHVSLTRINKAFLDTVDSNDFVLNDNAIQWYSPLKLRSGIGKPLYLSPFLRSTGKSTTSDVVNTLQSNTPSKFELYQNYPNPFNPTTTIEYYLPTSAFVTLKIFNVLGQEVATVLNNKLVEEGYDEISVDASRLSSGVYYYRLAAIQSNNNVDEFDREFVQTKKFIVIK